MISAIIHSFKDIRDPTLKSTKNYNASENNLQFKLSCQAESLRENRQTFTTQNFFMREPLL